MSLHTVALEALGSLRLDPYREWKRSQYLTGSLLKDRPTGIYTYLDQPLTSEELHTIQFHSALTSRSF